MWKETKFLNRIDTPAWRQPIDLEWRITLVVELSGLGESIIWWRCEMDRSGSGWHFCRSVCYDILLTLFVICREDVNLILFSLQNSMEGLEDLLHCDWLEHGPGSFVITNCRKLLFLRNCRSPHYVILPLHCYQGSNLKLVLSWILQSILHPLNFQNTNWLTDSELLKYFYLCRLIFTLLLKIFFMYLIMKLLGRWKWKNNRIIPSQAVFKNLSCLFLSR